MDSGTLSGIITALSMAAFIGIVIWAYSKRRKKDFDQAAQLPLDAERRDAEKGRNGQ
ncbi:CcoQ/FixQ family Cbb3-type cytochrome c oxidase assembly chaperone [Arhodomonas aquaeolei]|uniref:CcoQ/FixQ family Cbb3-type cytochrome c oxidase assembly chaperone n=1 Tax=Arhodomonas aquaeolei TaxID=2369 RepID=UPI00036CA386|nr:CcoQ/FixQ family Cbb3-type cytochrome c oxidase assembly chaperone [Arhodomonas aquaeolei]